MEVIGRRDGSRERTYLLQLYKTHVKIYSETTLILWSEKRLCHQILSNISENEI